jgi:hypothetical protein
MLTFVRWPRPSEASDQLLFAAPKIAIGVLRNFQIRQKALIDGEFNAQLSDSLPRVFILVNMAKTL